MGPKAGTEEGGGAAWSCTAYLQAGLELHLHHWFGASRSLVWGLWAMVWTGDIRGRGHRFFLWPQIQKRQRKFAGEKAGLSRQGVSAGHICCRLALSKALSHDFRSPHCSCPPEDSWILTCFTQGSAPGSKRDSHPFLALPKHALPTPLSPVPVISLAHHWGLTQSWILKPTCSCFSQCETEVLCKCFLTTSITIYQDVLYLNREVSTIMNI